MVFALVNLVLGIFLITGGFINDLRTSFIITAAGIVVLLSGFSTAIKYKSWEGTLNGFVGLWLILCGSWFNFLMPWNYFVSGGIIFVFALWNFTEHSREKISERSAR